MPSLQQLDAFQKSFAHIGGEDRLREEEGLGESNFTLPDESENAPVSTPSPAATSPTPTPPPQPPSPSPNTPPIGENIGDESVGDFDNFLAGFGDADGGPAVAPDNAATNAPPAVPPAAPPSIAPTPAVQAAPRSSAASGGTGPVLVPPTLTDDDFEEATDADTGLVDESFFTFKDLTNAKPESLPEAPSPESLAAVNNMLNTIDNESTATPPTTDELNLGVSDEELNSLGIAPQKESAPAIEAASAAPPSPADAFESFDLGGETSADAKSLPDVDDFLNTITPTVTTPAGEQPAGSQNVEVFDISDEDMASLEKTLSAYPLNVRVACEEALAEEVLQPEHLNGLVNLLVGGADARETARYVGRILNKTVHVPRGFKTGEELRAEQRSIKYIFVHQFLPYIRVGALILALAASVGYLSYHFIYQPVAADRLYKKGYALVEAGDVSQYPHAERYFTTASNIHRVKDWYYFYAEAFRDKKAYIYAEAKYEELLRDYPHDKKGALDYAAFEANTLHKYAKADRIIRTEVLDWHRDDREGLIALGDVNLAWGATDSERYESARFAYARAMQLYGWTDAVVERMLRYFIVTDNLAEVLPLAQRFMAAPNSVISTSTLTELGGYFIDKRVQTPTGVPDEHIIQIQGITDILQRAIKQDSGYPEAYYQLARYYAMYQQADNERVNLEAAERAFENVKDDLSPGRLKAHITTERMLGELRILDGQFSDAETALQNGARIYEDAVRRRILPRNEDAGRIYADIGDIEYFTKSGNLDRVQQYYLDAEKNLYLPPEIEYRLGATHYLRSEYGEAFRRFFDVSRKVEANRKLLGALAISAYRQHAYNAATGYYETLLAMLQRDRARLPRALPDDVPEHTELLERMMKTSNNLAVAQYTLSTQHGDGAIRAQAMVNFTTADRIANLLGRDAKLVRAAARVDPAYPDATLPFMNIRSVIAPVPGAAPQMFSDIDVDMPEPSLWRQRLQRFAPDTLGGY
jgi:tetratricopeptide (TPR) repeat protein